MSKIKISDLTPDNKNYNKGSEFGNSLIEKSLRKFGAGRSILLDKNNRIIAGNKTIENAGSVGLEDIIVVETTGNQIVAVKRMDIDLDSKKGRELALADNASAKASITWDEDVLTADWEMQEIKDWGIEIKFDVLEAEEDDFAVPDGGIETDIVLGDLFEIGEHRLLCGDSTDSDQVAKLMNGQKADMVFTDPPYGIKVVNNTSVGGGGALKFGGKTGKVVNSTKGFSEIIGDDTTETAKEFYNTCISLGFENFIIFGGNYFTDFLPPSMGWIVWYKKNTGNFADFEMAWTSFNKASRLYEYLWNGLSREGSRELELVKRVHPTQKPVGLNMQILQNYDCDIIYDGFLGSGSTMVASHQLKRKCYGTELDPKYCQVIVDRMKKLDPSLVIKKNGVIL